MTDREQTESWRYQIAQLIQQAVVLRDSIREQAAMREKLNAGTSMASETFADWTLQNIAVASLGSVCRILAAYADTAAEPSVILDRTTAILCQSQHTTGTTP